MTNLAGFIPEDIENEMIFEVAFIYGGFIKEVSAPLHLAVRLVIDGPNFK